MRYLRWLVVATGLLLMVGAVAALEKTVKFGPTTIDSGDGFYAESTPVNINFWPPLALFVGLALISVAVLKMRSGKARN